MSAVKLTADSGGGTVEFKAPPTTTSNAAKVITLSQNPGVITQVVQTVKLILHLYLVLLRLLI